MLTVAQAAEYLEKHDHYLILTHVRPDGDTVGCAAALCAALRKRGKTAYLLPNPGLTSITKPYFDPYAAPLAGQDSGGQSAESGDQAAPSREEGADSNRQIAFTPQTVVTVDIATENLFPDNAKPYKGKVDLAIDHHPSFEGFAKENIVRPEAAACAELLYDILARLGPVTPEIALPLYVGLSTDCGCFSYANTTARSHAIAAALIQTGIDYKGVNKAFFRTKTRTRMKLEAAMLRDATFYDQGRIVVMAVPRTLMEDLQATEDDAEELSSLGGQIAGVDCSVTMRELDTAEWKISLRTGPRVNATAVCASLGGGGHAAAAGCIINAPFAEARRRVLRAIGEAAPDCSLAGLRVWQTEQ